MFKCSHCFGKVEFSCGQTFLTHFQFYHGKQMASGSLKCTHTNCFGRTFSKFNSFRKHILSHNKAGNSVHLSENFSGGTSADHVFQENGFSEDSHPETETVSNSSPPCNSNDHCQDDDMKSSVKFDEALTSSVITFIATLYDCGSFTESQIQFIIESHMQLLGGGFLNILKDAVLNLLLKGQPTLKATDEIKNITRMFSSCQNLFEGFDTHYKRVKEVENCGAYIPPESFVIQHAQDVEAENGHVVVKPIELHGQFIPFRHVLKGFLELPGVFKEIDDYVNYLDMSWSESGRMENIIQGNLWRTKIKPKFQDKYVLPLTFTFDDYETNKELGTHTCVHKLGAGYVRIPCIPPKFQSLLENIFEVVLFHSADRACGNAKAFRKVISEFKFLEEKGITVVTPERCYHVFFALVLVTGDNLGANGILGFVESFNANLFCRVCYEEKPVLQYQTESNPDKRRTPESYRNDILVNDESLTGRKSECVFNELQSYDVSENVHLDIMHDLDEGVWRYVMFLIVKYLYDKRRFTIDHLNELIQGFYYGSEEKNRLPYISKDDLTKSKRLKFSGSEMRCFVRYFGLIVGHLVEDEDQAVWNLYLKARKIVDLVTAPRISFNDTIVLKDLIKDHHNDYMHLFETHLQPKFHLVVHEPDVIPDIGPLDSLSCYRTEHKHKEGKDIAHASHNRVNLPFTIAKRHQLKLAFRLLSGRGFVPKIEYSTLHSIKLKRLPMYKELHSIVSGDHNVEWHTAKWLEVNGARYTVGSVVLHSLDNDSPVFGQIEVISICDKKQAYFVLRILDVIKFNDHFHAYEIRTSNKWLVVNSLNLLSHLPTDIRLGVHGHAFVSFRFSVTCFT